MKRNQISAIANIREFYKNHIADVTTIKETIVEKINNTNLEVDFEFDNDYQTGFDYLSVCFTNYLKNENLDYEEKYLSIKYICDDFKFSQIGFDKRKYSGEKLRKHQIGSKSAWAIPHKDGFLLVSYSTIICYADMTNDIIYFDIFAYKHSNTTCRHISAFLTKIGMQHSRKTFADFE